jgi:hypothetical protein
MKDTKNLIRKRDVTIPTLIREAKINKDFHGVAFWENELQRVKERIELRDRNRVKYSK